MKILIDPLYTQRPRICSSSYLAWELIDALLAWRPDVFIYLTYPKAGCEPEDLEFLSRHADRVTLLDVPTNKVDRLSELYMLRKEMRDILHPLNKETWDIDVVISSRVPVIKHMVTHSQRPGSKQWPTSRMFIAMEDVPCLPFRDTVPWHAILYPDTLCSYLLADAAIFNGVWLKAEMRSALKDVFTPAFQKKVLEKIYEANTVKLARLNVGRAYDGGDFNLSFVGRITGTRNFADVAELFRKQFSYPIGKNKANIKFAISTNSQSSGSADCGDLDFIDLQMNDRDQFHAFLTKQHLVLNLSSVEDFSMSTYETLLSGVPMIVYDRPWTRFLGADYPFRVKNEVEVYALISAFAADYDAMYAKFVAWEATTWKDYVDGPSNVSTAEVVVGLVSSFEKRRVEHSRDMGHSLTPIVQSIAKDAEVLDLTALAFENLPPTQESRLARALGRSPGTLIWKIVAERLGFVDTSKTGVMVRKG